MEVKVTRDLKVVEYKSYIAKDGKEFNSERACLDYERELYQKELAQKLKGIEENTDADGFIPLDGSEYMEWHGYRWFRPKSIEEVEVLNEVFDIGYMPLGEEVIGEWVCIETADDESYTADLHDSLDHIYKFLDKFGYDVVITKR